MITSNHKRYKRHINNMKGKTMMTTLSSSLCGSILAWQQISFASIVVGVC
eukprot:m.26146 g.26146  ORF g.26146 m.26146 type:complete len:50 (+) comp5829_c0_seq1:2242-2391(+)